MKLRDVMNRVLRATGQAQIPGSTSLIVEDNHLLILEFLNQFKEEIEGYNWRSLRQDLTTSVLAGSGGIALVNAPGTAITGRSRLLRVHDAHFGRLIPNVYDVTDAARPFRVLEMDAALLFDQLTMNKGIVVQEPSHFSLDVTTANLLRLRLYPVPSVNRSIITSLVVPQKFLDVTDLDTEISIPSRALTIGTIWAILQERGEELGQSSMWTEERYRIALDDEVASDMAEQGEPELVPI